MWFFRKSERRHCEIIDSLNIIRGRLAIQSAIIHNMEHDVMADLSNLKASVADLTARVAKATSVEASTAILVQAMAAQNKDLAAKIAGLSPDTITQPDIDDLSQKVAALGSALDQATGPLSAAVAANQAPVPAAPSSSPPTPNADQSPPSNPAPAPSTPGPMAAKAKPLSGTTPDERAVDQSA